MTKLAKAGERPLNSRIRIDYSGKKPNIRFSYPSKKHGTEGSMFFTIFMFWITFVCLLFIIDGFYSRMQLRIEEASEPYKSCQSQVEDWITNNKSEIIKDTCSYISSYAHTQISITLGDSLYNYKNKVMANPKRESYKATFLMFILFGMPCLIYFPFRRKWNEIFPKYQAWGTTKKLKIFRPKDVEYNEKYGWFCEVPVFTNIIFNYEAKKEFSKYLKFFEIEEHKFKYYIGKMKKIKNSRRRKIEFKHRRHKELNERLWYARFHFKEKPQRGELRVLFR